VPSADADDEVAAADAEEVAADAGVAAPVPLLLLLQPAATRARTLSPAAAITRFMVEIPPLLGEKCRRAAGPAGDRVLLRPGLAGSSHHGETGTGQPGRVPSPP
jgi:hypothetical protein